MSIINDLRMRKGQVTLFVVLGIIIIFVVALIFYVRSGMVSIRPPVENVEVTDDVKPIQTYVNDCLANIATDAFILIGTNGGYINSTGLKISPIPYDSDALYFAPQVMPYWYYMRDCEESSIGCIASLKPPLCKANSECVLDSIGDDSIELQINKYIENNLDRCINDFEVFSDRFNIQAGDKHVETIIREDGVDILLEYSLDITVIGTKKSINIPKFATTLDINFKDIYELASRITQGEADTQFLEYTALNLISIYSGKDSNKLPPFSHVDMGISDTVTWTRTRVKEMLTNDVLIYISFLRVLGTDNEGQVLSYDTSNYSIYANGVYNTFQLKLFNDTVYDLDASISYPYSDIYLNIGDSELIKPEKLNVDNVIVRMLGIFMTEYKFKYDLSYPVIVKIKDPKAFNGRGYEFSFAMEANIRKNTPVKGNITVTTIEGVKTLRMDSELQKVNRTILIESYDKHTNKPLDNVIISYRCDKQYDIGFTSLTDAPNNPRAILEERFPFCQFGGEIVYEREGYMGGAVSYNNNEGNDKKTFKIELWPIVEKNVMVYKRTPANIDNIRKKGTGGIVFYTTEVTNITENETVFLNIERIKTDARETDIPLVGFIHYVNPNTTITLPTIEDKRAQIREWFDDGLIDASTRDKLLLELVLSNVTVQEPVILEKQVYTVGVVPGKYTLDAFMTYKGNITIPKKTIRKCPIAEVLGICIPGRITIEYPEQHFETWPNGGASINFTLTENDIYGDRNTIIFYVLEMPIPKTWDMLEKMQTPEQYQQGKTFLIRPIVE